MLNIKSSSHVYSIDVPNLVDNSTFKGKFVYNFYTSDESTKEVSNIPEVYKKSFIIKNDINLSSFSLRVPRYIELSWNVYTSVPIDNSKNDLSLNYSKIITQENLSKAKFLPYSFSSYKSINNAIEDINKNAKGEFLSSEGVSQATVVENFITDLLKGYEEEEGNPDKITIRDQIRVAIESIENFVDDPESLLRYSFFDKQDEKIQTGLNKFLNFKSNCQLNAKYTKDIFNMSTLSESEIQAINETEIKNSNIELTEDIKVEPVYVDKISNITNTSIIDATPTIKLVGYIIDKYKFENNVYIKDKTFFINDGKLNSLIDVNVMYGMTYHYSIRSIVKFQIPSLLQNSNTINDCTYYCSGKQITTTVKCEEYLPPPPPTEIDFNLDYKTNKFYVTWQLPFNSQRDIKQFQIFRRKSIHEPFELLEQQCFDFSNIKRATGEIIDGNNNNMLKENLKFVVYQTSPTLKYLDPEFKIDFENLISSKYIYSICSIDAHGFISNYSAQYQVSFDFTKNKLIKTLISFSGAPRPYPNLLLKEDLFKDIIQVSGMSSQKLKIYFMPEYFNLKYDSKKVQKMITTKQDGSNGGYYKLQFINVQNQKMDQLKINIDDPEGLSETNKLPLSRNNLN